MCGWRKSSAIVCMFWLCGASACFPTAEAQDVSPGPIRVESKEVIVPVLVLDKKRLQDIRGMDVLAYIREADAPNSRLLEGLAVRGLAVEDFRVFDNGAKQKIQRLTPDSFGFGDEPGAGIGKWEVPETHAGDSGSAVIHMPLWPSYLIAYPKPPATSGNCHKVVVKVDRPDSLVYSSGRYCNGKNSLADPLRGTKVGNQMEDLLKSGKSGAIGLWLDVFPFLGGDGRPATDITVGFYLKPRPEDCGKWRQIGVLGLIYAKNRTLATRFSDIMSTVAFHGVSLPMPGPLPPGPCIAHDDPPNGYETAVHLPPGKYTLSVILRDGKRFGEAETLFNVEGSDQEHLEISGIVLAKQFRQLRAEQREDASSGRGYVPLVSKGFEVVPTANTRFRKGGPFYFYLQIYDPMLLEALVPRVEAHLRIVNVKTGQVVKSLAPVNAASYAKLGDPVIPIGGGIDINGLPKGSYMLEAQATDSAGDTTSWRTAKFTIEH